MIELEKFDNLAPNVDEIEKKEAFAKDSSCLKTDITRLMNLSRLACEDESPKLYRRALKILLRIEDKLWKYYMEVYHR